MNKIILGLVLSFCLIQTIAQENKCIKMKDGYLIEISEKREYGMTLVDHFFSRNLINLKDYKSQADLLNDGNIFYLNDRKLIADDIIKKIAPKGSSDTSFFYFGERKSVREITVKKDTRIEIIPATIVYQEREMKLSDVTKWKTSHSHSFFFENEEFGNIEQTVLTPELVIWRSASYVSDTNPN